MNGRPVLIAAGGTGGHLFPAEALAGALARRGVPVELVTDERALKYGGAFPARAIHAVPSATPMGGSLLSKAMAGVALARGVWAARRVVRAVNPVAVIGFGGYPTVPPIMAAYQLKAPTLLHEQNAVMGRANRFLSGMAQRVATGFPTLGGVTPAVLAKQVFVGNPVRPSVQAAADIPYPPGDDGRLRVLVTGGSQGARVMSDVVPAALALLTPQERARVALVQQARGEDEARVRQAYAALGFPAEIAPFFADLPRRMAEAHLVVARAGASTVSELAVIGRPAILVPFPFALDQDQAANAAALEKTGAATVIAQAQFTPERLAQELRDGLANPEELALRAEAAKSAAVPDAAERLAELVIETAGLAAPLGKAA